MVLWKCSYKMLNLHNAILDGGDSNVEIAVLNIVASNYYYLQTCEMDF